MIPGSAVGPIHRLAYVTSEDDAHALIAEAVLRGASPDDAKAALELWRKARAADVHRVGGVRCLCGHGQSNHTAGAGQCWSAACGCGSYRPKEEAA